MKTTIYHNPRCSKSRTTLSILEEKARDFEIIKYLETPPNASEIKKLLSELGISARDLMRKGEAEYKDQNLGDESLTQAQLIDAMVATPKLIERPIVRTEKGTVIGRPPENVLAII